MIKIHFRIGYISNLTCKEGNGNQCVGNFFTPLRKKVIVIIILIKYLLSSTFLILIFFYILLIYMNNHNVKIFISENCNNSSKKFLENSLKQTEGPCGKIDKSYAKTI